MWLAEVGWGGVALFEAVTDPLSSHNVSSFVFVRKTHKSHSSLSIARLCIPHKVQSQGEGSRPPTVR